MGRLSGLNRFVVTIFVSLAAAPGAVAGEEALMHLEAAGVLRGDGSTDVLLRLRIETTATPSPVVTVVPSRGKVRAIGPLFSGTAEIAYRPPKVKAPTEVSFLVTVNVDGKRRKQRLSLTVLPAGADAPTDSGTLPASAATAANPLALTARPGLLLLEKEQRRAELIIDVAEGQAVTELRLYANVGVVTDPRAIEGEPGRFRATLVPEKVFYPHVAIVVATGLVGGERRWAWSRTLLYGKGALTVRAPPGTPVELTLAGRSFGPVRADPTGRAKVAVEVAPGHDKAFFRSRELPVATVPFLRAAIVPEEPRIAADQEGPTKVRVFAVTAQGEPLTSADDLRVEASAGTLGALEAVAPGVFVVPFTPPPAAEGDPVLRVSNVDSPEKRHEVSLLRSGGTPSQLVLAFEPSQFIAGDKPATLTMRVMDRNHTLTAKGEPQVSAVGAELTEVTRVADGLWSAVVQPPDVLPNGRTSTVSVVVTTQEGEVIRSEAALPLRAAPAQRLTIDPPNTPLRANSAPVEMSARAVDRFGNANMRTSIAGQTDVGSVGPVEHVGDGVYRFVFTPPRAYEPMEARVKLVAADGPQVETPLSLTAETKRFLVGLQAGWVSNFASLNAPQAAIDATYRLEGLGLEAFDGLAFSFELGGFHRWAVTESSVGLVEAHLTVLPVSLGARYHLRFFEAFTVYAGASGSGALLNSIVTTGSVSEERFVALGGFLVAGGTWRLGPGHLLLEARGLGLWTEEHATVAGFLGGTQIGIGYRFEVF